MATGILPRPLRVLGGRGKFSVGRQTPIVLSPSCDEADRFAASMLRDEIAARASLDLSIEKHARTDGLKKFILLVRADDLGGRGGREGSAPFPRPGVMPKPREMGDEGYALDSRDERLVLAASTSAGVYYGVQTLRQLLAAEPGRASFPSARIVDRPLFRHRGVLHDVSRGKVPRMETLFGLIELLGSLKMNVLQLYTEHTFSFRRHPDIGRGAGAFTPEDVMKLDERARAHHVELQPNLQSFGHMERVLSIRRYRDLAESDALWSVAPGRKETYAFLDDLYAEFLPCFSSGLLNADCDEVTDLGRGRSAARLKRLGEGGLFVEHVKALRGLAAKHGKRLAIWADMARKSPGVLRRVPKDVLLIDWDYGARASFAFSRKLARSGHEHWVAPGTNSWLALAPRVEVACRNASAAVVAGRRTGASGLLNTDWGDRGHPNLLGLSLHGFAWGAEAAWSGPVRDGAEFDRRFSWWLARDRAGLLGKAFRALGRTNAAFGRESPRSLPFEIYWAEFPEGGALLGARGKEVDRCERDAQAARSLVVRARQSLPEQKLLLDELDFAARQTLFACSKARLAKRIVEAVPRRFAGDTAAGFGGRALPPSLVAEVKDLHREWMLQRDEFERLWTARSRRSEIEQRLRLYRTREQEYARLAEPAAPRLGPGE
jgi:hypothetical protein